MTMILKVAIWMYFEMILLIRWMRAPQSNDGEVRIFSAWIETWDKKKLGTTGDPIF